MSMCSFLTQVYLLWSRYVVRLIKTKTTGTLADFGTNRKCTEWYFARTPRLNCQVNDLK